MRLDVLLNNKDFNKFTASAIKFWSKKKKRKFNQIDIFLYAGLFIVLLFYLLGNDLMLNWVDFLTGFIAGTLLLLMVLNEQKKILEPKENGFVFGPTVYEFNGEGISIKKEDNESFTRWDTVEKVFDAKEYFYIFIDHNLAYIIPKRIFPSTEKLKEFVLLLNQFIPGKVLNK
jgi:hypothetical protein